MAELINLRQARKAVARKESRLAGDAAAMKSGRPKAQKGREAAESAKAKAALDGKKLGALDAP